MSNVCRGCFEDKIARNYIRDNGTIGDCDFCGSKRRKVIEARKLRNLFEEVVGLYDRYEPAPGADWGGGDTLAQCLQEWEIFNEDCEEKIQNDILDEIMGYDAHDSDISAGDDWQAKSDSWTATPLRRQWPWFADQLKSSRRFIFEEDPSGELMLPQKWVPDLLSKTDSVREMKKGARLFRARMGFALDRAHRHVPLPRDELKAPPSKFAKAGRANAEGIAVLYCAIEAATAIVETGRFPGAVVTLRELRLKRRIRLADLTRYSSSLEPLATTDLAVKVANRTLLESLGQALGKPIHPEDSAIEYVPTQYLAEVIRSAGYDGICFQSALNPKGTNVVVFDPANTRITRRGWIFELGRAEYTIHPDPQYIVKLRRRSVRDAIP